MVENFVERPAEPANGPLQVVAAILLGIAATLTAVAAYQAAVKGGEALQGYTQSTRLLSDANGFYAQGNQTFALDNQLFVEYAAAAQEGNAEFVDYLTTLMRPDLLAAVDWWEQTEDAVTPFDETADNPYAIEDFDEAEALEDEASAAFTDGAAADDVGDKFELATVLLALTLFFGGIATLFTKRSATLALLATSAVALTAGTVQLVVAFAS